MTETHLLQLLLEKLTEGETDMPTWLLTLLMQLLESLVKKNDEAVKNGYAGPLTAPVQAWEAGKSGRDIYLAHCQAYCRCCAEEDKKVGKAAS